MLKRTYIPKSIVTVMLWFIIRNIYLVPISGTEFLKLLEFPVTRTIKQSLFMLMSKFGEAPKSGGWLPGEPTLWLERWNFRSHLSDLQEGHREMEADSITNDCDDFISHAYLMRLPLTPKRMGFRELLGWWTLAGMGRVKCLERAWELHAPSPYLALRISSIWLFLSYFFL